MSNQQWGTPFELVLKGLERYTTKGMKRGALYVRNHPCREISRGLAAFGHPITPYVGNTWTNPQTGSLVQQGFQSLSRKACHKKLHLACGRSTPWRVGRLLPVLAALDELRRGAQVQFHTYVITPSLKGGFEGKARKPKILTAETSIDSNSRGRVSERPEQLSSPEAAQLNKGAGESRSRICVGPKWV